MACLLVAVKRRMPLSDQLDINDTALSLAGFNLVTASSTMAKYTTRAPGQLVSVTGIGPIVHQYLMSMREGRLALADAAKTGSTQVAEVMTNSEALDRDIAASLQAGFMVKGAK